MASQKGGGGWEKQIVPALADPGGAAEKALSLFRSTPPFLPLLLLEQKPDVFRHMLPSLPSNVALRVPGSINQHHHPLYKPTPPTATAPTSTTTAAITTTMSSTSTSNSNSPLLAIVYSEFDNTIGPTIRCQAPEG